MLGRLFYFCKESSYFEQLKEIYETVKEDRGKYLNRNNLTGLWFWEEKEILLVRGLKSENLICELRKIIKSEVVFLEDLSPESIVYKAILLRQLKVIYDMKRNDELLWFIRYMR